MIETSERVSLRIFGGAELPTIVYLPGLHGDWTLATSLRKALEGRVRVVEITYPRSLVWTVEEYRDVVAKALVSHDIDCAWLLAESWGSQLGWALVGSPASCGDVGKPAFKARGLILAGGFVKHPWRRGPGLLKWIIQHTPRWLRRFELRTYPWYSRLRHPIGSVGTESFREFAARRTPEDIEAMGRRLELLDVFDPRPVACQTRLPVYYLAGLVDPLVPYYTVRRWLGRHCPGYRGGRTFWLADHNVLATAPGKSADQIFAWISGGAAGT